MRVIPYGRQDIDEADIAAVVETLRSDYLTQGPAVPRFEEAVQEATGARHAVAVNSATSALHIGCLAAGLGPGDLLWTSPTSFVASANCALYCGADVDFVDIDPKTYNLSVPLLAEKLVQAEQVGRLPKIVVPVHLTGQPADLAEIRELSRRYGFVVMEDASHAIGATYRGTRIGDNSFSDLCVMSFHPVKIVTTGEGGLVTTQDDDLASRLRRLRTHGITRDPAEMHREPAGPWYYEQIDLGLNYRMTDIHAALGTSQMKRLGEFVKRRREIAARYDELLAGLPLVLPHQEPDRESAWHLYVVRLKRDEMKRSHREVFEFLRARGLGVNLHYMPIPGQPYYEQLGFRASEYPEAVRYGQEAISIPMYSAMSDEDQDAVIGALGEAVT